MLNIFMLIASFLPLIYGANLLVDSASAFAKRFNIPNIVIGLTIVAFGTSSPELIVNVFASMAKTSDIALGNVIGSNLFNILFILGISAMVTPLPVRNNTVWIEIPLCLLSAVVIYILSDDILISRDRISVINRGDGLILLLFFLIFMVYNYQLMKSGTFSEEIAVKDYSLSKSILFIIIGLGLLIAGGKLIVLFSVKIAESFGVSERIIALTIISIGTSLPELATSAVAAFKKNVDIAIGNIVGSNIFNVFLILGISSVISDIAVQPDAIQDLMANLVASSLLFIFMFTGKGRQLDRWEGLVFLLVYICYFFYVIFL